MRGCRRGADQQISAFDRDQCEAHVELQFNGERNAAAADLNSEWPCDSQVKGSAMKAHQAAKISELGEALICAGHLHLDDQANVLGLSRSTTWTILHANHKNYGLSAAVINQMLAQPQLPSLVRMKIIEYITEKCAGIYGHNPMAISRFVTGLSPEATCDQANIDLREHRRPTAPQRLSFSRQA